MTSDTSEWVGGTVWLFACHPSPKEAQCRAKKEFHLPVIYPTRKKGECVSEHLVSPIVWDTAKGVHFALTPSRVLDQKFCYGEGGSKSLGEWQIGILKDIKRMWILTAWQISLRSSPMSSWECPTNGSPQMAQRHPQCSPHTTPLTPFWADPCAHSQWWHKQALADGWWAWPESWKNLLCFRL